MPCGVNCPTCGTDGTLLANEAISRQLNAAHELAAPTPVRLRVDRPAPTTALVVATPEAASPVQEQPRRFYTRSLEPDGPPPPSAENIPMGILGGLIAGFAAMMLWYGLTLATGRNFGAVAWLVGLMTGLGVRVLGRDGTAMLGVIAAGCASAAILGGEFLNVNDQINKDIAEMSNEAYQEQLTAAKEAVAATSDDQIKTWLANNAHYGSDVSSANVDTFRSNIQPRLKAFVNGQPSQEEYSRDYKARVDAVNSRFKIFNDSISLFTILFVCFGIASAYRIGSA